MQTYVILLRGINVGGGRKIKMAELKELLASPELEQINTYIQSGNLVLRSSLSLPEVCSTIAQKIKQAYGYTVTVIGRTSEAWRDTIDHCPYAAELAEGDRLYVSLLSEPLADEWTKRMAELLAEQEHVEVRGQTVYLWLQHQRQDSALAEQLISIPQATMRTWKTVLKLKAMAEELDALN